MGRGGAGGSQGAPISWGAGVGVGIGGGVVSTLALYAPVQAVHGAGGKGPHWC